MTEETGNLAGDGGDDGATTGVNILEAFCRAQLAALPRGSRGVNAAMDLLVALPAACRLGWSDMTVSAPQLFRMLENAGLISSYPTASDIPPALRLVESVGGLVTQRSPRRWTVWFSSACDPDHALGASIRKVVTPAMLERPPSTSPTESSRRTTSIREERNQLARELDSLRAEFDALQAEHRKAHAKLERERSLAEQLRQSLARTTEQHEAARRELESVRSTALHIQARRVELRQDNRALVQRNEVLEEELTTAQRQATRSDADFEREREHARREASLLRTAKEKLEQERTGLQTRVSELEQQGSKQSARIRSLRDDIHRVCEDTTILRRALDGVQEIFDVDRFDPETPDKFLDSIDRLFQEAQGQASHVAAECARILDRRTVQWLLFKTKRDLLRKRDLSLAEIDSYFENHPQDVFENFGLVLEKTRSDLAAKGVVLPPTELTLDDLRAMI
ncbi:MAG: hypothetical protein H6713_42955 [Myxococcales bacterium]|nr:hypothetical protein [Myxococcales bacterium]